MFKIGQGVDAHAFCEGDGIVLGGVRIPFEKAVAADSDGDVLYHALCDALLGAFALGDLGAYFSDVKPGCDSGELLDDVLAKLPPGARIVNVDATVIVQKPKIAPFVGEIRRSVAKRLNVAPECVSVKATTTDHLGFTGRGEGIAALAVVLIEEAN